MRKNFFIAGGVLAVLLFISILVYISGQKEVVVFQGKNVDDEEVWSNFKEKASNNKKCKITIKIGENDKIERELEFDGEKYIYRNGKNTVENTFLIDVRGKAKNVDEEKRYIILAGHEFTYDEITTVIYSNTSEKNRPFYLIHCN